MMLCTTLNFSVRVVTHEDGAVHVELKHFTLDGEDCWCLSPEDMMERAPRILKGYRFMDISVAERVAWDVVRACGRAQEMLAKGAR